ncbi:MAG: DUF1015 domain-containing protein [Syntrophorhabdales bacterium]|jgi:uncharacterized protein (DUF1015 family)
MSDSFIKPFRGLIYNRKRIDDIADCVCPPYDIIPDPLPYYKRSDFNAIRLELPVAEPGADVYDAAKKTLDAWLAEGVLSFDAGESIYLYEQEFMLHGKTRRRTGMIPLVRLDRERILTHEETRQKAREDRERLIRRLSTYTSLVFSMYEDKSREIEHLIKVAQKEKMDDFVDELSIRNTFYRMSDPSEIGRLVSMMEEKNLYIADGHHRLSVAFKLGLPYVAMYLTDMDGEGIAILPYHRIVSLKERKGPTEILTLLEPYFHSSKMEYEPEGGPDALVDKISSSPLLSFLLYFGGKEPSLYMLKEKRTMEFDPESHPSMRSLKVNAIHRGVLKHLLGVKDDEISFLNSADEAVDLVRQDRYDFAVLVPSTSVEEVKDIADNRLYMPPKSTYFYPKILTGLVFYKYA